jgi:hypothetical protein
MIISKPKKIDDLLKIIGSDSVFIIGCSDCATLCHSGGEEEVYALKNVFEKENICVTGTVILDPACHLNNDKHLLKSYEKQLRQAKKIVVLACGNGVQTVAELYDDKEVIAGTDTLFLGEIKRLNEFEKRCTMCGECLLDTFSGFCPVSRCPKSMLNGPCGGSKAGKCEINQDMPCVWDQSYANLKKKGKLPLLQKIQPPKDWSKSLEIRRNIGRDK